MTTTETATAAHAAARIASQRAYLSVGADITGFMAVRDDETVHVTGYAHAYPTLGLHLSPDTARELARQLLAAVEEAEQT